MDRAAVGLGSSWTRTYEARRRVCRVLAVCRRVAFAWFDDVLAATCRDLRLDEAVYAAQPLLAGLVALAPALTGGPSPLQDAVREELPDADHRETYARLLTDGAALLRESRAPAEYKLGLLLERVAADHMGRAGWPETRGRLQAFVERLGRRKRDAGLELAMGYVAWLRGHIELELRGRLDLGASSPLEGRRHSLRTWVALLPTGERPSARVRLEAWCEALCHARLGWRGLDFSRVDFLALVDLDARLSTLAIAPDLTPRGHDERAVARHPAAMLLLPADHSAWADLSPQHPIRALERWAVERDLCRGDPLWAALDAYRAETSWLAACTQAPPKAAELTDALKAVFRAAAAEPIAELRLPRGVLGRLERALAQTAPNAHERWILADLPDDLERLAAARGVSFGTVDAVGEALVELLPTWRHRRAGVHPGDLVPGSAGADETKLAGGLDELATLFEETEDT